MRKITLLGAIGAVYALSTAAIAVGCVENPPTQDESGDSNGEAVNATIESIVNGTSAAEYPESIEVNMVSTSNQGYACSGTLIAPRVVLTAGHCVDGMKQWTILGNSLVTATKSISQTTTTAQTYDWAENGATTVNPNHHDIGLIYLSTPIVISSYPTIASSALAAGSQAVNVGRILNNVLTNSEYEATVTLSLGTSVGFPFDYYSSDVIEHGDSGGGVFKKGTHQVVAVNSGAGSGTQVLARVDLLASWINTQVAAHGGYAPSAPVDAGAPPPVDAGAPKPDAAAPADAGKDSGPVDAGAPKPDAAAPVDAGKDSGPVDAGKVDAAPPPPPPPPACVHETEANDTFATSNPMSARECGTYKSTSDVDWYKISVSGVSKISLTGDGTFGIGQVVGSTCTPQISGQKVVQVTVSGSGSVNLCVNVSYTGHTGTYEIDHL